MKKKTHATHGKKEEFGSPAATTATAITATMTMKDDDDAEVCNKYTNLSSSVVDGGVVVREIDTQPGIDT